MSVIGLIVFLFYVGDTKISFSPFRVHVERPFLIVACLLFTLAVIAWQYHAYYIGFKEGYQKATKDTLEVVEQQINEICKTK